MAGEVDYNKMQEAFERALKARGSGGGFSSGPSTPSSSTPGPGALNIATNAVSKGLGELTSSGVALGKSFGDITGKLVTGGVRVSDVTDSLTKNFKEAGYNGSVLGKAFGGMGKAVGEVVKYVEEGVDNFRELSKTGASFNNSIIELRSNAAQTRMTLAEYGQVVKENSGLFTTFGGTVSQGAKKFTEFSKEFFDSPVADELRLMGYNTQDLNSLLALQTTTMKMNQKLEGDALKREIEAARNLAVEMDTIAKLTGQSRKEQEEKLRKDRENGQLMAAIDLAMMKGGKDVQKAFDGMTTAASMGGKDFQRLQQEIFAMGRPSEEMASKFAMIGGEAQKLMMQAAEAAKKGNTEQAKLLTQQAAAAAAQTAGSESFQNLAAQGSKDFGDLSIQLRKNRVQLEEIAEKEKLDLNTTEGLAKANELRMKMAKDEQQADKDNIAKSAILAEARAKDTYTAINNALVTPLQEKVNPALKGFADKLKELNTAPGGFRGTAEKKIGGAVEAVGDAIKQGQERVNREGPGPQPNPEKPVTAEQKAAAEQQAAKAADYQKIKRNEGSLGAAGKLFENWGSGTMVELHGIESVMKPEDLEKLVTGTMSSTAAQMGSAMSKASSQGIDVSKISKDISTTISSSTAGGASASRRPSPNMGEMAVSMSKMGLKDDQKKVFDEIMTLNSQQSKEKIAALAKEKDAAFSANKAATAAIDAIEEKLEAEGKGFKDLTGAQKTEYEALRKQQSESYDAGVKASEAMSAARKAEEAKQSLEKLGYDIVVEQEKEKAKIAETTSEQIKSTIIEALPVKDLEGTLAEAAKTLDDHGKTTLKYAMRDSEEQIAMYKSTAEKSLELNKKKIEENNGQIAELEEKAKTQELSAREKNRIERLKAENEKIQENSKFREQEVEAYKIAEEEKKKALTASASELSAAAKEMLTTGRVSEETFTAAATAQTSSYGTVDDSEMGGFATTSSAPQSYGTVDDSEMGGFASTPSSVPSIDLNALNLPGFGPSIKSAAATVAPAVNKPKEASPGKKINPETGEEYTPVSDAKPKEDKKPSSAGQGKSATLDDVVKELAKLNTKIAALAEDTKEMGAKQERATRSSSQNIYQR